MSRVCKKPTWVLLNIFARIFCVKRQKFQALAKVTLHKPLHSDNNPHSESVGIWGCFVASLQENVRTAVCDCVKKHTSKLKIEDEAEHWFLNGQIRALILTHFTCCGMT